MHVLLADAIDDFAAKALREVGFTVAVEPTLTADDLPVRLEHFDALVVRSTKVGSDAVAASPKLSLIVRAGAGVENIDVDAASSRGVHVCNVPARNAVAVAELTMGLLLATDRHVAQATADLREGRWNKTTYSDAKGLMGRTIGIVGLGEIGLCVAERAKAFGLVIIGLRRPGRQPEVEARIRSIGVRLVDTLEELVAMSDIVSLHVPASDRTAPLVDSGLLALFRDEAILLNTSRGDVVDEGALIAAMNNKNIRAGLDVFCDEPSTGNSEFHSKLAKHPNVIGTHHVGASTRQAQLSVAVGVVDTLEAFRSGAPINCCNILDRGLGVATLSIRHFDRVGVLASVFSVLRGAGVNVQHMENRMFEGGTTAVASMDVSAGLTPDIHAALLALPDVLGISLDKLVVR